MRHERELRLAGYQHIAGIDEVGRGSLAGPVVAAAVILPERHRIRGIREVEVIDKINILQATKLAMGEAVTRLTSAPDHLVIDALSLPYVDLPQRPIIDGDAISASIAAASIVAKVTRDRICAEFDERYPAYGFAVNKGYGTRRHYDALMSEGPCAWHRRSFAPIKMLLAGTQLPLDLVFDDLPLFDEYESEPLDDAFQVDPDEDWQAALG
ncbi:MAG: ribonuclease HII [Chloroflexi bacterium]|nr:MAG: ribonuclease HII [Chloroflexota bacterium]